MTLGPAQGSEWRSPRKTRAGNWNLASSTDIDRALRAAEGLLGQAQEATRHEQNIRLTLFSLLGATVISLIGSLTVVFSRGFHSLGYFLTVLSTLGLGAATIVIALTLRRRLILFTTRRDYRLSIACDIAHLVDDVYIEVGEEEKWSYLHLESIRLRLSAFPLLTGSPQRGRAGFWKQRGP